ncbi:hypothetical protein PM082_014328 [Marasmius tenuissimus]|nr:hypothetical protein PM082_014328 [Marasmius tenuissimus]
MSENSNSSSSSLSQLLPSFFGPATTSNATNSKSYNSESSIVKPEASLVALTTKAPSSTNAVRSMYLNGLVY